MGIQAVLDSLDEVPEDMRDSYHAEDGKFILNFDLLSEHPGLKKVRETANDMDRKRKAAEKLVKEISDKYGDLDPEAARSALEELQTAGDKKMIDEGQVEELVAQKIERMKADFDSQLSAKSKALEDAEAITASLTGELADVRIYDAVKDAALTKGARKDALQDIQNRAKGTWMLKDGKPVAMNGEDSIFGKSGEALTIDEWVDTLSSESSYLFEPNKGGGATGNDGDSGGGTFEGVKIVSKDRAGDYLEQIANGEVQIQR